VQCFEVFDRDWRVVGERVGVQGLFDWKDVVNCRMASFLQIRSDILSWNIRLTDRRARRQSFPHQLMPILIRHRLIDHRHRLNRHRCQHHLRHRLNRHRCRHHLRHRLHRHRCRHRHCYRLHRHRCRHKYVQGLLVQYSHPIHDQSHPTHHHQYRSLNFQMPSDKHLNLGNLENLPRNTHRSRNHSHLGRIHH
jgi:hypothetical protein